MVLSLLLAGPQVILSYCTAIVSCLLQLLLLLSFLVSVAYYFGWIHRWLWYVAETEISKLLNGTPVTIGHMELDLIRGKVWASNIIFHSPKRHQWKWQSPVLARVGTAYAHCNLVYCIFSDLILREEVPLDVYTAEISDVQVFVERKQDIFNFWLVDPHVQVPDPIIEEEELMVDTHSDDSHDDSTTTNTTGEDGTNGRDLPIDTTLEGDEEWSGSDERTNDLHPSASNGEHHAKAQKLVNDMVRAIGKASQGSLSDALAESRERLKTQLKALQRKKKSQAMKEGVKIVQHVSKSLVEKSQKVPQVVLPARVELATDKDVYGRFGRIVVDDARIFTRDHRFEKSSKASSPPSSPTKTSSTWNKPIYIRQVQVRASDLCPPVSAKDDQDLPVVYQTIDKSLEVLWKRILTEIAKSNTGRLFQTAMGEVLDYWMDKDGGAAAPATTTSSSASKMVSQSNS